MARPDTKTDRVLGMIAPKETPEGGGAVPVPAGARDIQAITADILTAKQDAGNAILRIGRALMEAKEQLPHGDWLDWLEREVDFSERTAENFMRIAREYSNPQLVADLGVRKAVNLLAIPAPEREAFIAASHTVGGEGKTVQDMTARELEQAIRERDEARREAEEAKARAEQAEKNAKFEKDVANKLEVQHNEALKKLAEETLRADSARAENARISKDNAELREKVREQETKPTDVAVETKVVRDEDAVLEAVAAAREEERKKREAVEVDRDGRQAEADEQRARADALAREVETLKKAQEDAEKAAAKNATPDRAAVGYLVESVGADLNRLAGYHKKALASGDTELVDAVRRAAAVWITGLEGLAK